MGDLNVIYRSNSHAPLWILLDKVGIWEQNGLKVDTSPQLHREKAVDALRSGSVDVISGNHHNLFVRRLKGEDFVHLAQVGNRWTETRLVMNGGLKGVADLKGKRVALGRGTSHEGLNVWLFLRQEGLDADRGDVQLVDAGSSSDRWNGVVTGDFDATFVGAPYDLRAAREGATVVSVRPMPMIRGVTLTTTMTVMREREPDIRALVRGLVEGIHFFLTRREETLSVLRDHAMSVLGLESEEEVQAIYDEWCGFLERKPYPTTEAIDNVFALALRRNPEVAGLNPLSLWDTHYLRELDDTGFIDALYE